MKKASSIISIVLVLALMITTFGGTTAFAEEVNPTTITFVNAFEAVETVQLGTLHYYEFEINKPELSLTVKSSDDAVAQVGLQMDTDNEGYYRIVLAAYKAGDAVVTVTASDGTVVSQAFTVDPTAAEKNFTVSADVTGDFALPKGSSRIIKVHYESNDADDSYPLFTTDDQEKVALIKLLYTDYQNNDYYYQLDAVGNDGETGKLYLGGSNFIPDAFYSVTIAENDNLRIDTASTYVCNIYDSYRFTVYTTSATAPEVSSNNNNVYVEYVGKVSGGYEYRMDAEEEGDSMVQATLSGETSAFAVHINYDDPPLVKSDTSQKITLAQGASYTYKFTIMGGGEPSFVAGTDGVVTAQLVKKDGINYYCKVTAVGQPTSETTLNVTFPDGGDESFNVNIGTITVSGPPPVVMKSDTNSNFSLKKGASYQFKISNATSFHAGTAGIFKIETVKTSGSDTFYKITAIGQPGQQTGLYMSAAGQAQKICVVTISAPDTVAMKSDTNVNFSLKQGGTYQFKITGATSFSAGSAGVFKIDAVGKSGSDTFYKITAIGKPGQQTGLYMSAAGQVARKVCVVTVAAPVVTPVTITSDTNTDFAILPKASYQFKLTAPGASSLNFCAGTAGVYQITPLKHTGNDFFYKIVAVGQPGQETGLYASVPGQTAKKICKVSIKK